MTPASGPVCAVVVTYGGRSPLAAAACRAALAAGVEEVVIVANGSPREHVDALRGLADAASGAVMLVILADNLGSAGGFGAGIRAALSTGHPWVWLLDDDNVPEPAALKALRAAAGEAETPGDGPQGFLSYRRSRGYQRAIVEGGASVTAAYPAHASFLDFHLANYARLRLARHRPPPARRPHLPVVPYGPYGGLFAARETLVRIGTPLEQLIVYGDDTEYTHRIARLGGRLRLVAGSVVTDADENWFDRAAGASLPARLLQSASDSRVYYSVRNRVFFERRHWRGSEAVHRANRLVYMTAVRGLALRLGDRQRRVRLIARAVRDGEVGRLGYRAELPLP